MRLVDAEANRAKHAGEIRCVERAFHALIDHAFVDQILQSPQPGDVRLRFFNRGIEFLQLLAHGRLLAVDGDVVRSQSVHQLVRQNVCEERIEREVPLLGWIENDARDRNQGFIELRVLHVLQHDPFRAFFLHDPLVVRQIERGRLHAAVSFA